MDRSAVTNTQGMKYKNSIFINFLIKNYNLVYTLGKPAERRKASKEKEKDLRQYF